MACDAYDMNPESPYYGELKCLRPEGASFDDWYLVQEISECGNISFNRFIRREEELEDGHS